MSERRRLRLVRIAALIAALAVLGLMVWQLGRGTPTSATAPPTTDMHTLPAPASTVTPGKQTTPPAERDTPLPPLDTDTLDLTATVPSSPADQWADRVLDQVLPTLEADAPSGDGFAWWQNRERHGLLAHTGNTLTLNGRVLPVDDLVTLDMYAPDSTDGNHLTRYAHITWAGEALRLTALSHMPDHTDSNWLLSTGTITLAIESLVQQAANRDILLLAAYTDLPGQGGQLVLIEALSPADLITPTATLTLTATAGPSPTASVTALPTATPRPTDAPSIYLERAVIDMIDPVIDAAGTVDQGAVTAMLNEYPIAGALSWSGTGAAIGGVDVAMEEADEVTFYRLRSSDQAEGIERFLQVVYDDGFTRLVDAQEAVWGRRMEEVLYWMAQRAAEQDGQLYVVYEDFGSKQSVIVIGSRQFETGEATPTP